MRRQTLEQRVAKLERQLAALLAERQPPPDGWRQAVGMFTGDPLMKEIDKAGRAWREADRRAVRRRTAAASPKT